MLYINENLQAFDLAAALASISEQRRVQALRFKHEQGRRESVAAYLLLKDALSKEFGIDGNPEFEYDAGGKPRLKDHSDIFFNLSHCREAAVCVVDTVPVGVDIETVRSFKDALARHVLSPEEYSVVAASFNPAVEFIKLWTQKEAVLKLTGEGIRSDLKTTLANVSEDIGIQTVVTGRYVYTVCRRGK